MCLVLFRVLYCHIFICSIWAKTVVVDPTIVQHANYNKLAIDPSRGDVNKDSVHPIVKRYAHVVENNDYVDPVCENSVCYPDYEDIAYCTECTNEPVHITYEDSVAESEDKATKKEPDTESPTEPKSIIVNPTGSKEELCLTQKQSLLEFGKSYGKRLKTWLSDMGRIHLANENSTYQKAKLVGKFKVERGYMHIDNKIVFQPSRFRYQKLQKLPLRAVKGVEVIFQYLVPSIDIHYNYSQEAFWKNVTGTFDVVLKNQLVVISMIATKDDGGKCYAEDRALDITFNVRDYKVRFKVNGGGFLSEGVSSVGKKVINTFVIKRLLPLTIKRAMLGKLEEIRLASKRHNAPEFYKELDSALCNGIDLDCV